MIEEGDMEQYIEHQKFEDCYCGHCEGIREFFKDLASENTEQA